MRSLFERLVLSSKTFLERRDSWRILSVLLAALFAVRHFPTLSQRVLLWDDFMHFSNNVTFQGYREHVFGSLLHFIPLLHTSYALLIRAIPLESLSIATSYWVVFWVVWYCLASFRLCRLLGLSPLFALVANVYVVFNPLFAEAMMWFCSSFYLVGLVLMVEGIFQFEYALKFESKRHLVAATVLSMLAPCFWTLGYLSGFCFAICLLCDKEVPRKKWPYLGVIFVAIGFYPLLRLVAQPLGHHVYGVIPANPKKTLELVLQSIPDALVMGSLGFWRKPHDDMRFAPPLLYAISFLLVLWAFKLRQLTPYKKAFYLGLFILLSGIAIPFWGRGNEFSYNTLRLFLRYYPVPLFGASLLLALSWDYVFKTRAPAPLLLLLSMVGAVAICFGSKMPEHYLGGGGPQGYQRRLKGDQLAQLKFLQQIFTFAKAEGVSRHDLTSHLFVPITGSFGSNGLELYAGVPKAFERPFIERILQYVREKIRETSLSATYQMVDNIPLSADLVRPRYSETGEKVTLSNASHFTLAIDIDPSSLRMKGDGILEMKSAGGQPVLGFSVPERAKYSKTLIADLEVPSQKGDYEVAISYLYQDPAVKQPTVIVTCKTPRCRFNVPSDLLPWFPNAALDKIMIKLRIATGTPFTVWKVAF